MKRDLRALWTAQPPRRRRPRSRDAATTHRARFESADRPMTTARGEENCPPEGSGFPADAMALSPMSPLSLEREDSKDLSNGFARPEMLVAFAPWDEDG